MLFAFVAMGPIVVLVYLASDEEPADAVLWVVFWGTIACLASVLYLDLSRRRDESTEERAE